MDDLRKKIFLFDYHRLLGKGGDAPQKVVFGVWVTTWIDRLNKLLQVFFPNLILNVLVIIVC